MDQFFQIIQSILDLQRMHFDGDSDKDEKEMLLQPPASTFFLNPRQDVRVKMTQKQYVTVRDPKMYIHTKF